MADAAPRIVFTSDKPRPTWNSEVHFIEFCIENPHRMADNAKYSSRHIEFEGNPRLSKIFLSVNVANSSIGVFVNQVPLLDIKIIYNITLLPRAPGEAMLSRSTGKHLRANEMGWGFVNMLSLADAVEAEQRFQEEQSLIEYIPAESRPAYIPFKISGRFTLRFISDADWEKHSEAMTAHAHAYLYLERVGSLVKGVYPKPPPDRMTLEGCMARMLDHVEADQGVVTFKVGPGAVSIQVNSCIIQSRIGVPLLREGLAEAASKEIRLPHVEVGIFRIFLQYLYTQKLPDSDLRRFSVQLMALADQYIVPDLFYKTEYYLCWITQNYPGSADFVSALKAAEEHNAATLKKACFAALFAHGRHLMLDDPAFETLSHKTVLDMLRDHALRRAKHMPDVPAIPPALPPVKHVPDSSSVLECEDDDADDKQKKRRKGSGGGV
jgi:hypothetical protein